jgi:sec1 family domain-containing protein 1
MGNSQLHSDRQTIADVPAVYFVEPSSENIARICQDLKDGLYESVYLNFTCTLARSLMEDLAYHAVQTNTFTSIVKVSMWIYAKSLV